jgi:hypothetical protein
MRRDIENIKSPRQLDECCPGHDDWPCDTYRNRRSKRARARDIKREHRYARRVSRWQLLREKDWE